MKQSKSLNDQQEYYDRRWVTESPFMNRLELMRLIEILRCLESMEVNFAKRRLKICDLGCGRGLLASHLASFGDTLGVDLSASAVAEASKKWPHIEFRQANVIEFDTEQAFDVVVSSEVLEHVPDKEGFFRTVSRILKPGGHVILTTPNLDLYDRYIATDAELQPIEQWLSLKDLRAYVAEDYITIRHETFTFDVFYSGFFRLLSAPKLIRLCRVSRLEWLRQMFLRKFDLGLHQIYHGVKKG